MRVRNKKTISNKVGAVEQIFTQPVEKTAKWHFFLYFNIPSILVSIPVVLRFFGVIYSAEICQLQLIIGKSEKWSFQSNPHLEDFKDFLIQILKIYLNVNLISSLQLHPFIIVYFLTRCIFCTLIHMYDLSWTVFKLFKLKSEVSDCWKKSCI